jgi:hypothetical protein
MESAQKVPLLTYAIYVFIRNDLHELKPAVLTPLIPLKTSLNPLISPSTEMKCILMESAKGVHI